MPGKRSIEITVEPNEIVVGDPHLEVRAEAPLDPEVVRGAITLESASGRVSLSRARRVASFVPRMGCRRVIRRSSSASSFQRRASGSPTPSRSRSSSPTPGPACLTQRVESIVRLQVGRLETTRVSAAKRPDGRYIEILKAVNRRTGKPTELAFDQRGAKIDANAVFEKIRKARRSEYGKLHPTLKRAVAGRKQGDLIPVAVWLRVRRRRCRKNAKRAARPTARRGSRSNRDVERPRWRSRWARFCAATAPSNRGPIRTSGRLRRGSRGPQSGS